MSTLDPAVCDLLAATHDAIQRPHVDPKAVFAASTAIRDVLLYPAAYKPAQSAAWLRNYTVEAQDAYRVRAADRLDLYAAREDSA
jgi:hypothetical protein